jgi:hypothetical protein
MYRFRVIISYISFFNPLSHDTYICLSHAVLIFKNIFILHNKKCHLTIICKNLRFSTSNYIGELLNFEFSHLISPVCFHLFISLLRNKKTVFAIASFYTPELKAVSENEILWWFTALLKIFYQSYMHNKGGVILT